MSLSVEEAATIVQRAIENGADVNAVRVDTTRRLVNDTTPLVQACTHGYDQIVGILLDAGADASWTDRSHGWSAIAYACSNGRLSTVQLLINHDNSLLGNVNEYEMTPLFYAIFYRHSDIVRFLLDSGADPHHVNLLGQTALMLAVDSSLDIVRMLLDAGVDVEIRDRDQQTALHHAVKLGKIEVVRELILERDANMFAVDENGQTPFDIACYWSWRNGDDIDRLLHLYGNKLTQNHRRLALHELLAVAEYNFPRVHGFHPQLNSLRIILPLGKLTLKHLRTLLHSLDPELIRNRDDTGKLPIHIACCRKAPVDVLALILELDPTALHIADSTGALPIHLLCGTTTAGTKYYSVRFLVEQGGVGTLAARNHQGASPLHGLCGSTNAPLQVVQYLIQLYPESLAVQANDGQYPFMIAAADSSSASLSVIYELVRGNPNSVVPR